MRATLWRLRFVGRDTEGGGERTERNELRRSYRRTPEEIKMDGSGPRLQRKVFE